MNGVKGLLVFCFIFLCGGCSDPPPEIGTERGPCYGNQTCNEGLECLSDICVEPGNADGNSEGNSEGGSQGTVDGDVTLDSGSLDGQSDGVIVADSGSLDGQSDGVIVVDSGSLDG
jgi:hypothetical protein